MTFPTLEVSVHQRAGIQASSAAQFPHLLWGVIGISKALLSDLGSLLCARHWRNVGHLPSPGPVASAPLGDKPVHVVSFIPNMPEP